MTRAVSGEISRRALSELRGPDIPPSDDATKQARREFRQQEGSQHSHDSACHRITTAHRPPSLCIQGLEDKGFIHQCLTTLLFAMVDCTKAAAAATAVFYADAATMPLHWIYDREEIASLVGEGDALFYGKPSCPFYKP